MSVNHSIRSADSHLMELPHFELRFAFDDDEAPRWVTIYARSDEETITQWISMDVGHVVELDEIA